MFDGGPVHMVGIGGSGMASLAEMLLCWGVRVSGSDIERGDGFWRLFHKGVKLCVGHDARNLPPGCRLLIHSAAVPPENPEIKAAKARGIPTLKYAQALGAISQKFRTIAVAGTHGKTTVTAMISRALQDAYIPCCFVVGGDVPQLRALPRPPKAPFFVTEACEFDRSFLNLRRTIGVVTNIEPDHLDCYTTKKSLQMAFLDFMKGVEEFLVTNADDKVCMRLARRIGARLVTFGRSSKAHFRILHADDKGSLVLLHEGRTRRIHLSVIGEHNCYNAACAFAVLVTLGLAPDVAATSLSTFSGVARRLQVLTRAAPFVVDDYAHHPTEIKAVIRAVSAAFPKKTLFIFQPHQHTRLHALFDEFVEALACCEEVMVLPVYSVREGAEARRRINHAALGVALEGRGVRVHIPESDLDALHFLLHNLDEWRTLCFMGAGDVYRLARRIAAVVRGVSSAAGRLRHAG